MWSMSAGWDTFFNITLKLPPSKHRRREISFWDLILTLVEESSIPGLRNLAALCYRDINKSDTHLCTLQNGSVQMSVRFCPLLLFLLDTTQSRTALCHLSCTYGFIFHPKEQCMVPNTFQVFSLLPIIYQPICLFVFCFTLYTVM